MAGTEPLNEEGNPLHCEAEKSRKAQDGGKDGWIKKKFKFKKQEKGFYPSCDGKYSKSVNGTGLKSWWRVEGELS